jgi:hypothetical protein
MEKPCLTMAQQVAEAAAVFEKQRTGHAPQAVTVVLGDETRIFPFIWVVLIKWGGCPPGSRQTFGKSKGVPIRGSTHVF